MERKVAGRLRKGNGEMELSLGPEVEVRALVEMP